VDTITASKFKATCLALLDRVKATGKPILITKNGKPVAVLSAPEPDHKDRESGYGMFQGEIRTLGDIVSPLGTEGWEVLRDDS